MKSQPKKADSKARDIALKILSGPAPFLCDDCRKRMAWFDTRFGKAICDFCWKANNYAQQIMEAYPDNKGQIQP